MTYIPSREFLIEVAKGNVPGHSIVHKFGRNPALPNGTFEFVDLLGPAGEGPHAPHLSAASTVRIKAGGNANDTAAGSHAQEVTVEGLDSNWAVATEAIATNGASASSSTTTSFLRVYRAWVSASGTYGTANDAAVTIENTAGTIDMIQIAAERGQSQYSGYTIPSGYTGFLLEVHFVIDTAKQVNILLFKRENADDVTTPFESPRLLAEWDGASGNFDIDYEIPVRLEDHTDIWVEAAGDGAVSGITADYHILLVENSYVT